MNTRWFFGVISCIILVIRSTYSKIKILTYNIKSDYDESLENSNKRMKMIEYTISKVNSDIICLQELSYNQIQKLKISKLSESYGIYVRSRDIYNKDEALAILYKQDKFSILDSGEFWLSSLPDLRGSKFIDMEFPRVVIWSLLNRQERHQIYNILVINVHLDSRGHSSRTQSIDLVIKKMANIIEKNENLELVILAGDFNQSLANLNFPENLIRINYRFKLYFKILNRFSTTFQDYSKIKHGMIIDYIFILEIKNTNRKVYKVYNVNNLYSIKVINNKFNAKASDHYPVLAHYK
jgi:endonuclease/exonuclease/phosphatase family metal-dependent hydrolase